MVHRPARARPGTDEPASGRRCGDRTPTEPESDGVVTDRLRPV